MNDVVAIDGPSASGKSTVARHLAKALDYLFVDSGSLYRGVTWKVLRDGVDAGDAAGVELVSDETGFDFFVKEGAIRFRIDGIELYKEIRTEEINRAVSKVAAIPAVRRKIVDALRGLISMGNLVIEGRDIGTAVFPGARHKFYIDASAEERARRRHGEMAGVEAIGKDEVLRSIQNRDKIDSTREMDPLRLAAGAERVDTTNMTIEQVVKHIESKIKGARQDQHN